MKPANLETTRPRRQHGFLNDGGRLASTLQGGAHYLLIALLVAVAGIATAGEPSWTVSPPLMLPGPAGSFDEVAVKDPSIVRYADEWHVLYTARSKKHYSLGYTHAPTLEGLSEAPRHQLTNLQKTENAYAAAPQLFYFAPQEKWYAIYQSKDAHYQPVYATNENLRNPEGWSAPEPLAEKHEQDKWIDFWVICDATDCYLFYTRNHRTVAIMSTARADFPNGFSNPRKVFAPVHEAVHVYAADGDGFRMLYERRGSDGQRRFGLAKADALAGPWKDVSDRYATPDMLAWQKGQTRWTDNISHGEFLRSGYDETIAYDPTQTRILFQGVLEENRPDVYSLIPWRLGVLSRP